jgi:hypothetical protein
MERQSRAIIGIYEQSRPIGACSSLYTGPAAPLFCERQGCRSVTERF